MATVRIQVRRGTASQWTSANPILAAGELGVESDTNLFKFGNGSTTWTALAYANNSDVAIGEISQDAINTALTVGSGLTKTYNDGANTITIAVDASYFNELAQDAVNTALTAGTGITKTYDDAANTLTVAVDSTIATKTYADDAVTAHQNDTTSVHGITNTEDIVYLTGAQTLSGKTLSNVVLSGTPTAPTQAANDNSTKIATTAYVQTELADLIGTAPALLDTLGELSDALNDNESYAAAMTSTITGINNSLATKLPTTDFTAHLTDTTDVHGISNTANLVYTSDSRLSDNRTPVNGSVVAASMAADSITTASITDAAVTGPKIADDAVTAAKIAASAVGTSEIADDAVTAAKIATGSVGSSEIASNAVGSDHIAASAVGTSEIEDNAVTAAKIAASAVGTSEIADDAVTAAKIATGSVGTSEIADDAVTEGKIAGLAVTSAKIADLNITTAKINDSAVTEGKIAGLAVTEGKIADGSVSTVKIADSAVTSGKIANGTIVDADINESAAIAITKINGLGTALDSKLASSTAASTYAPIASPTFTGTVTLPSTTVIGNVTATEIEYVDGVTSAIQTQLDAKAPTASPTFTGTVSGITKTMVGLGSVDNTADTAKPVSTAQATAIATAKAEAIADATAQVNAVIASAPAALNTLDELAAALGDDANFATTVTTSLAAKAPLASPTFTGTVTLPSTTVIGNVTATEIGYVDGVTSAIQTQLDAKAPTASPTFTGTVTVAASGVAFTDGTQTKEGVPSRTVIGTTISAAYNLSTGGLALRDQLIPISGTQVITVPTNATTAYPIGTSISFYQASGTGASFAFAGGVTPLATPGQTLRALASSATLTKVATDTWLLAGDLKA